MTRARTSILMTIVAFALGLAPALAGCGLPEEEEAAALAVPPAPEAAPPIEEVASAATTTARNGYRCGANFCSLFQGCCNGKCTRSRNTLCGHPGGEGRAE